MIKSTNKVKIKTNLIAPCGMNCGICLGYLREKNHCSGCNAKNNSKLPYCSNCRIKNCPHLKRAKIKFCYSCDIFPCARLKHLDRRYRTRYGMSMIDNQNYIMKLGIRKFVKKETTRWSCPNCRATICVHRWACVNCGRKRKR